MNRKSSLYPGVNGTGVGGPPLPGPTLRSQPQAFHRPPPRTRTDLAVPAASVLQTPPRSGTDLGVPAASGSDTPLPSTPVPSTPGYSELLRFIKNRFLKERHPTVRRTTAGRRVAAAGRINSVLLILRR